VASHNFSPPLSYLTPQIRDHITSPTSLELVTTTTTTTTTIIMIVIVIIG